MSTRWRLILGVGLIGIVAACSSGATKTSAPNSSPTSAALASSLLPGSSAPTTLPTTKMEVTTPTSTIAATATTTTTAAASTDDAPIAGATRYSFTYGPIEVKAGQNNIAFSSGAVPKPPVDGFIVRMKPDIQRADKTIPRVDEIHLHHGVWVNTSGKTASGSRKLDLFMAAGEEKTITTMPAGYGYPYTTADNWIINYMIHNLNQEPEPIWITYDLDVIPATSAPSTMKAVTPIWMDVQAGNGYPVFDVMKGSGTDGVFTYPDDATEPYSGGAKINEWTADRDVTLVGTAGHLHPGGLYTDLNVKRGDAIAPLFRSEAKYFEPAGPVSWDLAMSATPSTWRATIKAGDTLSVSATYETKLASWYESMGIMVVWAAEGSEGPDPFTTNVVVPGALTHGQLAENRNHGGEATDLPDAATYASQPALPTVPIASWIYAQGDLHVGQKVVPTVKPGQTITFDNLDAPLDNGQWHTITSCKAPCNRATGIAYPLADGPVIFDSGQLGTAGVPTAGRTTWTTPADLPSGTYTYFCRIHPKMRGAFRVDSTS
jgi:plastocyanin